MHIVHPPILPDNPRIERFSSRGNEITRVFCEILNDFAHFHLLIQHIGTIIVLLIMVGIKS